MQLQVSFFLGYAVAVSIFSELFSYAATVFFFAGINSAACPSHNVADAS